VGEPVLVIPNKARKVALAINRGELKKGGKFWIPQKAFE
jgi:hypothetical protein